MDQNDEKKNEIKPKIVPAYAKKDISQSTETKKSDKKENKKVKSKISILVLLLIILLVVGVAFLIIYNIFGKGSSKLRTNTEYEKTIRSYGFEKMYNNSKAASSEPVTKGEAIKIIIAATLNVDDISDFADKPDPDYTNGIWIKYAQDKGIIYDTDINEKTQDKDITYIEAIRYLANSKVKLLRKELNTNVTPEYKDYGAYKPDEQIALQDMIENDIIDNSKNKLNANERLTKGLLNELICRFIEKYSTLTIEGEKININPDKMPSNKDQYPYTLLSVDKKIYEISDFKAVEKDYKNSKDIYNDSKRYYNVFKEIIGSYFNTILNVDYTNINSDNFKSGINEVTFYSLSEEKIDNYINYVKTNKIKITGKVTIQYPAVYFDGERYRVRTKVEYNVENASEYKDLLLSDYILGANVEYKAGKTEVIIDIPINKAISSDNMYLKIEPIQNQIAGSVKKLEEKNITINNNENTQPSDNSNDLLPDLEIVIE